MENTIFSVIPPLLAIIMVVLTRRVLFSLAVGIVASAVLLSQFQVGDTVRIVIQAASAIFFSNGELNTSSIYIILFLLLLGMITAFISISGGSRAFGDWAMKRVKTRSGSQFIAMILGIIIFIDDYFNALAVGQVTRPITDRQKVARVKLAYIIDSTSAPICIVSPISSWGAYIIALIGTILTTYGVNEYSALSAFIKIIPMNYYVWAALGLVFIVVLMNFNIGAMKEHEQRAQLVGELYDPTKTIPGELKTSLPASKKGTVGDLIWPIVSLFVGTIGAMIWTGISHTEGQATIYMIFENTDVAKSLVIGGTFSFIVTLIMFLRHAFVFRSIKKRMILVGMLEGMKSMLSAIYILLFAWTIVDLIGQLGTGTYLAGLVERSSLTISYLPLMLFLIAGAMAFSTGTSWGSFGILLPIAGDIAAATDIQLLIPAMAAVLAGAVFGDHCSPISDTTILSSTGAAANHIDHVITQLPYAIICAGMSLIGYLVLGLTGEPLLGLAAVIIMLVMLFFISKKQRENLN